MTADAAVWNAWTTVTVEASDDRKTWRIVRNDLIVYRVADDNGRGNHGLGALALYTVRASKSA